MRKILLSSAVSFALLLAAAGPVRAAEVPRCVGSYSQSTIYSGQNPIENLIVGGGGVLYASGNEGDAGVLKAYTKGVTTPRTVTTGKPGGGGLAWEGRKLLWGYGDLLANGQTGDVDPKAGLYRVNTVTGAKRVVSDHLGMANGIARGRDGSVYASNTFGVKLDRITRSGVTQNGWAGVGSANGLVVGKNGRYLYANQMLESPSKIARIDIRNPSRVGTFFTSPEGTNSLFDGLARDGRNNLYVAVFGKGEVWKVGQDRQACVLATGLSQTTSVAISGARKGFRAGNLYAAGFDGKIIQVTGATKARNPS
jgi:sugar lactone lactonase YvrE